jgi:predicted transposase/invertase (TIGR01784 family)
MMPFRDGLPEILPPSEDGVFQSTFIHEDAKPALLELLSDILDRPLTNVTVCNNELPISDKNAKREVFDINCIAEDDHSQMDVEMQATQMEGDTRENEHKHIRNRSVFNLSDLHASQPGRGVRYADFHSSYQITICNYNVFNWDNELVENFTYRNECGRQLSDITTAIFFDLTKTEEIVRKPVAEMTAVEQWAVFLAKANDPGCRDAINEILKRKEGISVAYEMLTSISTDANERARFRSRRMWQMDRDHELAVINSKWEKVVADKDELFAKSLADKDKSLADKDELFAKSLADKDKSLADKDELLADKDKSLADAQALIAELRAKLDERE